MGIVGVLKASDSELKHTHLGLGIVHNFLFLNKLKLLGAGNDWNLLLSHYRNYANAFNQ